MKQFDLMSFCFFTDNFHNPDTKDKTSSVKAAGNEIQCEMRKFPPT